MVHVPEVVKRTVYNHLFKNNGLVMKDTVRTQGVEGLVYKDAEGNDCLCRNLYVNCLMKSLKSRNYVKDTFTWQSHYFMLTKAGEDYIRYELDIDTIVRPTPCAKQIVQAPQPERTAFRKRD
ncbi:Ribosomal protein S10 [Spironucleus salmonicida]|uniref:Ribosomal protein S10 n=1 Tax=Spironucleus salmonicida TaxID=348837 RepID=V6LPD7_9EUKA|nr:Ribosomal protein S10 [Spironucleus salmonicida]|eukprot:EST46542.1 Ribosomal protein S10 [Spironucleus salmonicida]